MKNGRLIAVVLACVCCIPCFVSGQWVQTSGPSGGGIVCCFAVSGGNLFAGTKGGGVWIRPLAEMVTSVNDRPVHALPSSFSLHQNYPNPFNPQTRIEYELPEQSRIRMAIYNVLGQEISTLEERVVEAGHGNATWDASRMPGGIYFYRLEATSVSAPSKHFSQTRKMALIK